MSDTGATWATAPSPKTATASSVVASADYAINRFRAIGITLPSQSRLFEARSVVEQFARLPDVVPDQDVLGEATRTIFEFYWIARACGTSSGTAEPRLRESLEWALTGPLDLRQETPRNSRPRNTQFELFVGAWLTAGGATPILGEPDLRFTLGAEILGIAAKRVRSRAKLVRRAKEGADQILSSGEHGIVVLNVDAVVDSIEPGIDTATAGDSFARAVPEFDEAQDALKDFPYVRGLWMLGTTVRWDPPVEGEPPFLRMHSFRRMRFFPDTDEDVARYNEFISGFNAVIATRMERF